jgi:integrase/recombinase XerD
MQAYVLQYVDYLKVKNHSTQGIAYRQRALEWFCAWLEERGVSRLNDVTRPMLERYARHLHYALNRSGKPLSVASQSNRLTAVRRFFRYLVQQNHLLYNPASELELPRPEYRLPKDVLTAGEVERVMTQPELATPEGLMHRAVLEVLYSTGVRRAELIALAVSDVNVGRGVVAVRQGKGRKDRFVPIGDRALLWVQKYLDDVRSQWAMPLSPTALFLDALGRRLNPYQISRAVQKYVIAADVGKTGRCHLFRHTMATLMLENGADIRYIQHILGHAKLSTTEIYTHVAIAKLKDVHTLTHPGKLPADVQAKLMAARREHDTHRLSAPTARDVLSALAKEAQAEIDEDNHTASDNP